MPASEDCAGEGAGCRRARWRRMLTLITTLEMELQRADRLRARGTSPKWMFGSDRHL